MKKAKLNFNFLSAAGTVFGYFAVLFTREPAAITVRSVRPTILSGQAFFPRR
jgi:hypothetical protein